MDEKELKEIFEFLQGAGANPQLCDTEVPYFETSVRAGLPTENFAEEAFVEMMSLPRKMLASTPAMILDIDGDSMEDANLYDGDRVLVLMKQRFRDGDIVVARIGDGYTVKCYYEDDEGKHWLVAQNKEKECAAVWCGGICDEERASCADSQHPKAGEQRERGEKEE